MEEHHPAIHGHGTDAYESSRVIRKAEKSEKEKGKKYIQLTRQVAKFSDQETL